MMLLPLSHYDAFRTSKNQRETRNQSFKDPISSRLMTSICKVNLYALFHILESAKLSPKILEYFVINIKFFM